MEVSFFLPLLNSPSGVALGVRTTDFFCELAVCSWARHFPLWTSVPHLPEEGIGQFDPYGPLGLSHSKVLYFSEASTEH